MGSPAVQIWEVQAGFQTVIFQEERPARKPLLARYARQAKQEGARIQSIARQKNTKHGPAVACFGAAADAEHAVMFFHGVLDQ